MGRLSQEIFQLNHLEEAELNLRASQIDLLASGVRIINLLFLVLVFRHVQRDPRNAGSKDRAERPGLGAKAGTGPGAGSTERAERPGLGANAGTGTGSTERAERPGLGANTGSGLTGSTGLAGTGPGADEANAGSADRDERLGLGAGATGADGATGGN